MIAWIAWAALAVVSAPLLFFSLRIFIFLIASLFHRPLAPDGVEPATRFLVLIPAHNEEKHVSLSVKSALAQQYPAALFRVVVLADNCEDATADVASEHGAEVEVRDVPGLRGKHHAIRWLLAKTNAASYDALVILDADTVMEPDYLAALDRRFRGGAAAAQGFNGVLNPDDTMLTRLTLVTNTMKNRLYYAGKASLGLSVPLMNGMAVSSKALAQDGFAAETVAEDFETYLRLAAKGAKVAFAPEVRVRSLKATGFGEAYEQRMRWSAGQSQVARSMVPGLVARAIRERSILLFDAAMDLAAPGYAPLTGAHALLLAIAVPLPTVAGSTVFTALLATSLGLLALNFLVGLLAAGPTPARAASVLLAPVFVAWKGAIALRAAIGKGPGSWVRGAR